MFYFVTFVTNVYYTISVFTVKINTLCYCNKNIFQKYKTSEVQIFIPERNNLKHLYFKI